MMLKPHPALRRIWVHIGYTRRYVWWIFETKYDEHLWFCWAFDLIPRIISNRCIQWESHFSGRMFHFACMRHSQDIPNCGFGFWTLCAGACHQVSALTSLWRECRFLGHLKSTNEETFVCIAREQRCWPLVLSDILLIKTFGPHDRTVQWSWGIYSGGHCNKLRLFQPLKSLGAEAAAQAVGGTSKDWSRIFTNSFLFSLGPRERVCWLWLNPIFADSMNPVMLIIMYPLVISQFAMEHLFDGYIIEPTMKIAFFWWANNLYCKWSIFIGLPTSQHFSWTKAWRLMNATPSSLWSN